MLTTLTKEAMPLVRYRTRDLTRLLPGTARTMRRIARVTGRSDDMMIVRGVNVFPTQVEDLVLAVPELAGHYQIVLTREERLDRMLVRVEARPDAYGVPGVGEALARTIRARVGVSAEVAVEPPGTIERSAGKARRVLDKRAR